MAALFALDAFGGGLIVQSLLAYWFHLRYGVEPAVLGSIFFGANVLAGISALLASRMAARFGLVNTMVLTHVPSNVLLILVPLMPNLPLAILVLLVVVHEADDLLSRRTEGTGLGLAITHEIVRACDGSIRAESTPGGGATFVVELPLAELAPGDLDKVYPLSSGSDAVEAALKLDPNYMPAFYHLGRTAAQANTNLARGEEALKKYVAYTPKENEPTLANAHYYLGDIYEKEGRKAEARQAYEAALKLNPSLTRASEALKRVS